MASGLIILWQIEGVKEEARSGFIFLVSKITADSDCIHEIKRCLFFGRIAMTNLVSVLKSRDNPLMTEMHLVKAMVFPVVMNGCKRWTIKLLSTKNWCFQIGMLEKTLKRPWTAWRSNQLFLKEINPKYSLEGLMMKLKLQYFGPSQR